MASGFLSILVKQDNIFYIKKKLEFGFLNTSKIVKILDNNSYEDLCLVGFGFFIAGLFLENKQTQMFIVPEEQNSPLLSSSSDMQLFHPLFLARVELD